MFNAEVEEPFMTDQKNPMICLHKLPVALLKVLRSAYDALLMGVDEMNEMMLRTLRSLLPPQTCNIIVHNRGM